MVNKEEYLLLSGIQHFKFCKRQWALIHIEQLWKENVKTLEGQYIHRKTDQPFVNEKRKEKVIVRAMPIKSERLMITGVCDVVEFLKDREGALIPALEEKYKPYPVEYKRGKPKYDESDKLQMVAQAMCLEEMLCCEITKGYIFYHQTKKREHIEITNKDKENVEMIIHEMHHYFDKRHTPKVKTGAFCKSCSLNELCLPKLMNKESVSSYIERKIKE